MKKAGMKGFILIVLCFVICGLFYYVYLSDKGKSSQSTSTSSEAEHLLNYDFDEDYPKTVRETVKLHNRFLKAAYNGSFSDEELEKINKNIRQLLDAELLDYNSEEVQLSGLKEEIQSYKDEKKKFVNFSVEEGSQTQYNTDGGQEYAKIKVTLIIKVEGTSVSVDEEYLLRQDVSGRWKILGWQPVKNSTDDKSEDDE